MASKNEVVRIDYPKHWFVMGSAVWAVTTISLFYLSTTTKEPFVRTVWIAGGSLVGILLGLFFVPPLFTHNAAGEKSLRIHMGLLVDTVVPYAWIKGVKEVSVRWGGVRVGIGVRYSSATRTLFATTEFADLVSLRLDGPHVIGRFLKRQVEELVLSASYKQGLVDLVRQRADLPPEA